MTPAWFGPEPGALARLRRALSSLSALARLSMMESEECEVSLISKVILYFMSCATPEARALHMCARPPCVTVLIRVFGFALCNEPPSFAFSDHQILLNKTSR